MFGPNRLLHGDIRPGIRRQRFGACQKSVTGMAERSRLFNLVRPPTPHSPPTTQLFSRSARKICSCSSLRALHMSGIGLHQDFEATRITALEGLAINPMNPNNFLRNSEELESSNECKERDADKFQRTRSDDREPS